MWSLEESVLIHKGEGAVGLAGGASIGLVGLLLDIEFLTNFLIDRGHLGYWHGLGKAGEGRSVIVLIGR